jgi:hypothetical protein
MGQLDLEVDGKYRIGKKIGSGSFSDGIFNILIVEPLRGTGGFSY